MKLRIAVVQFEIKQYSPSKNLKKAEEFIKEASDSKANIIVFPEDFVTGPIRFMRDLVDTNCHYENYFQKLAKKYKIDIVPGSFIDKDKYGSFNVTRYIDSSGKIKSKYKKVNLWIPERKWLTPGDKICVFNTKYGKIGLLICWDLIFPEMFRKMAKMGVKIVICPSYWCSDDAGNVVKYNKNAEINLVDSLCSARAFENGIVFVYCNAAGKMNLGKRGYDKKSTLIGHSQITVPFRGVLKKLEHNKEEMFIEDIDTSILNIHEQSYKIRKDLKKRLY